MSKHGMEYDMDNPDDVAAKEDYLCAADMAAQLVDEFEGMDLLPIPALGGAITQLLAHLITISSDTPSAMSLLSTCILNAAIETDLEEEEDLELH
tara:strand:+ start:836 stop:1120 length:285 start_codon:yes stop_codon:yes gene_type:complete